MGKRRKKSKASKPKYAGVTLATLRKRAKKATGKAKRSLIGAIGGRTRKAKKRRR